MAYIFALLTFLIIYLYSVKPRKIMSPVEKNLRGLYDAIRDYREPKANRQLALIFMKLPSKIVSI